MPEARMEIIWVIQMMKNALKPAGGVDGFMGMLPGRNEE